jgi:hypothetical protein
VLLWSKINVKDFSPIEHLIKFLIDFCIEKETSNRPSIENIIVALNFINELPFDKKFDLKGPKESLTIILTKKKDINEIN